MEELNEEEKRLPTVGSDEEEQEIQVSQKVKGQEDEEYKLPKITDEQKGIEFRLPAFGYAISISFVSVVLLGLCLACIFSLLDSDSSIKSESNQDIIISRNEPKPLDVISGPVVTSSTRVIRFLAAVKKPKVFIPLVIVSLILVILGATLAILYSVYQDELEFVSPPPEEIRVLESNIQEETAYQNVFYLLYAVFAAFLFLTAVDMIIFWRNTASYRIEDVPRRYMATILKMSTFGHRVKMFGWAAFLMFTFAAAPLSFLMFTSLVMSGVFQVWIGSVVVAFCAINLMIYGDSFKSKMWRIHVLMFLFSIIASMTGGNFGLILTGTLMAAYLVFILTMNRKKSTWMYVIPLLAMCALQVGNIITPFPWSILMTFLGHILISGVAIIIYSREGKARIA